MVRRFSVFIALILLVGQILTACGGHGGSSSQKGALRATPITAQVSLPTGASVGATGLRVWTSGGASTPNASGKVPVVVFNDGPQYTEARDGSGNLVLMGFLGRGRTSLDAASTAEALGYFAMGAFVLPPKGRMAVLEGLRKVSGFSTVVERVSAQLTTGGKIDPTEPSLNDALESLVANAGGNRAAGTKSQFAASSRGTIVQPTTSASGISLDTITDGELKISNAYLRRAIGWLEPTSYELEDGSEKTASGQQMKEPFEIGSPKRFAGLLGTLSDIYNHDTWSAVTFGPLPIPAAYPGIEGCVATNYDLTVVGIGANRGDFDKLSDERAPIARKFMVKAFVLDYAAPFVASILVPANGDAVDDFLKFSGGNAVVTDLINTLFSTAPNLWQLSAEGKFAEAFKSLFESGLLSQTVIPKLTQAFLDWASTSSIASVAQNTAKYAEDAKYILGTLGALELALNQAETFIIAADLAESDQANVFKITSTGGKVSITADRTSLPGNETTPLTAVVQNRPTDAVYRYEWRVSSGFRLTDAFGKTTDDQPTGILTTSRESVSILAKDLKPGIAHVQCAVIRIDGAKDQPIDTGKADITFTGIVRLSPNSVQVAQDSKTTFTASYSEDVPVRWRYSLSPATLGTLSTAGPTSEKTVTFTAGRQDGTVTLTAEAILDEAGKEVAVGKGTASITVGALQDIPLNASFEFEELPNLQILRVFIRMPKISEARNYQYSYNFDAPTYHWDKGKRIYFGPETTSHRGGWTNTSSQGGPPPPVVDGQWRYRFGDFYCNKASAPDNFDQLKVAMYEAWANVTIKAFARPLPQ